MILVDIGADGSILDLLNGLEPVLVEEVDIMMADEDVAEKCLIRFRAPAAVGDEGRPTLALVNAVVNGDLERMLLTPTHNFATTAGLIGGVPKWEQCGSGVPVGTGSTGIDTSTPPGGTHVPTT